MLLGCISQKNIGRLNAAFIGKLSQDGDVVQALRWAGAGGMAAASTFEEVQAKTMRTYVEQCQVTRIDARKA